MRKPIGTHLHGSGSTALRLFCFTFLLLALAGVPFKTALASGAPLESDLDRYSDNAKQALAAKKWPDAVQALEHLVRLAPDVAEVRANLGLAYFFEGRPAEALACFEHARQLSPRLPEVTVMIGLAEAELGRCSEAIEILKPAFNNGPDGETNRLTGLHLLRCYSELKQGESATEIGESLVARFPADPEILYSVSHLHAERSSELMAALLRSAPDSAWMHYANAQIQDGLDRFDSAAQEYRHALERDPGMPGVHYRLGRLILRKSRSPEAVEEAKREFQQELAVAASNSDAEYELGEIDREQSKPEAAITHFGLAIRYHPEFVEARIGMARALLELGHTADAVPHLREAERLDPDNKVPHYLLASAYRTLGESDRAEKEFALYRNLGAGTPSTAPQDSRRTEK